MVKFEEIWLQISPFWWVYGLFLSLMGGKMGLQKAILEGKLALYIMGCVTGLIIGCAHDRVIMSDLLIELSGIQLFENFE